MKHILNGKIGSIIIAILVDSTIIRRLSTKSSDNGLGDRNRDKAVKNSCETTSSVFFILPKRGKKVFTLRTFTRSNIIQQYIKLQ